MRGPSLTIAATCYYSAWLAASSVAGQVLLQDIDTISQYWGQQTPYSDNNEHVFGVGVSALPARCQVEQAHILHRHAQRFPTGGVSDGANNERFAQKVQNFSVANPDAKFTGALDFLNYYEYLLGESYLTGLGAATEFKAGVTEWSRYGRILYNATKGQLAYNASFPNGTTRPKPVLRTTGQSRIQNSQINWALGFFGVSFTEDPNPTLTNFSLPFEVVVIPEGGTENNTLASYDSCYNDNTDAIGYNGDSLVFTYIEKYLGDATERVQQYAPEGFKFSVNDTYAMQSICAYESGYLGLGNSDFCLLFTEDEWTGYEATLDILYYYDYSYGNPTGRAQGIGYVQELLGRLTKQYLTSSNSSVNYTIDNNPMDFPLDQAFYLDMSHDDILVSALTAMSVDYFRSPPSLDQYPPDPYRNFVLSRMTPFGARLVTEVIGCADENPVPISSDYPKRVQYTSNMYGYDAANASYKFIRMRLNNGVIPLNSIRGGACDNGRTDGMCSMQSFINSQVNATTTANYQYACFANYTITNPLSGQDWDGAIATCTQSGAMCIET